MASYYDISYPHSRYQVLNVTTQFHKTYNTVHMCTAVMNRKTKVARHILALRMTDIIMSTSPCTVLLFPLNPVQPMSCCHCMHHASEYTHICINVYFVCSVHIRRELGPRELMSNMYYYVKHTCILHGPRKQQYAGTTLEYVLIQK